ncbi:hypothetical protein AB0D27_06905 [Streptomyces sp. NPDC048415]|uniref:hypothetical protein n=1 Tax=Streptomyces sp. NPDC048415 TaxID=3154822 RepID=UPI003417E42A
MTDRMKPPARRTTGRTLGGAKKTTPPPPPPAAELTPEQFAAERAADQGDGRPAANESQVEPAPSTVPVEGSAQGRTETSPEVLAATPQPTVEGTPDGRDPEPAVNQPLHPATPAPDARWQSAKKPAEQQASPAVPAAAPVLPTVHGDQPTGQAVQPGTLHATTATPAVAVAGEVAVRQTVAPMAGGTTFPVRTDGQRTRQEQDERTHSAPSQSAPWTQGSGRPQDIPEAAVVLNQRIITRESLDSSVPAALKLKKRLKRFALDNELDHLPIGDIVSVALDEWLTARGF